MPFKDLSKQREFQRKWAKARKDEFLKDRTCSQCPAPATKVLGAKSKGKTFSWTYSASVLEVKLKEALVFCETHGEAHARKVSSENSTVHGHAKKSGESRTYQSWKSMRERCNNTNHDHYEYYGGRGISVCERWNSFENFLADLGPRPEAHTVDRINPNGNYEPLNCRWADHETQARNKRNSKGRNHFQ